MGDRLANQSCRGKEGGNLNGGELDGDQQVKTQGKQWCLRIVKSHLLWVHCFASLPPPALCLLAIPQLSAPYLPGSGCLAQSCSPGPFAGLSVGCVSITPHCLPLAQWSTPDRPALSPLSAGANGSQGKVLVTNENKINKSYPCTEESERSIFMAS